MTKNSEIIQVTQDKIKVRFGSSAACKGCNCLFKGFGDVSFDKSELSARVGDIAVVSIPDRNIVLAPFLVFVVPLLSMGLGLLIGGWISVYWQVGLMLGLLAVSMVALYLLDKLVKGKVKYRMSLLQIIPRCDVTDDNCQKS